MNGSEAVEIDRDEGRVLTRDLVSGDEQRLPYDKLAITTGARTIIPDISGMDMDNIFALHGLEHAEGIRANLAERHAKDVTIVGGGLIGVEMTESLIFAGCRVSDRNTASDHPAILAVAARITRRHGPHTVS